MKKAKVFNILKIVVIVILAAWVLTIIIDYVRTVNGNNPMFCIHEETKTYPDGTTYICTGLGYKMYRYERDFNAVEFGPFFTKERTSVNEK